MKRLILTLTLFIICLYVHAQDTLIDYNSNQYLVGSYAGSLYKIDYEGGGESGDTNLVAYYQFTGNTNDASGNGFDLTNNSAVLDTGLNDQVDGAYNFSGSNYLEFNITEDSKLDINDTMMSISCWLKIDSFPSSGDMVFVARLHNDESHNFPFYKYALISWDDGSGFYPKSWIQTTSDVESTGEGGFFSLHTWYHLVMVYDGSEVCTYMNGVQYDICQAVTGNVNENGASLRIGMGPGGGMRGTIDEVKIFDDALISSEITDLYDEF